MKIIFLFSIILLFQQFKLKTLTQIENEVFGTTLGTQHEQKITDFKKLVDTSQFNEPIKKQNFYQLKEMKDIQKEKQAKIENERKLKIQEENKLKSNEIDISQLLNDNISQDQVINNQKGRKLFFKKVISTVAGFFKKKKSKKGGKGGKGGKQKPQTHFQLNQEKDYIDKKQDFYNLEQEGLSQANLYKHLFGKVNLNKVKKIKGKKIKVAYYEMVTKMKCLQKKNNKCIAEMPIREKVKKFKTVKLENGQIPFDKFIITSLKTGNEFKAKEIRRFEKYAQGYQRLFKDKIIQRYQRERDIQVRRWDKKWNKARSKQELKYQKQLKMAIDAYHQFIEDNTDKINRKYKKKQAKTEKQNIKGIENRIKKQVRYYMKKFGKQFKNINKNFNKEMKENDERDQKNMKRDLLRNKFIQKAYFANSKVVGKVPEAYVVDKTPLIK